MTSPLPHARKMRSVLLAGVMVSACLILGIWMSILEPERAFAYILSASMLPLAILGITVWGRSKSATNYDERVLVRVSDSLSLAGLIMVAALGLQFIEAQGWITADMKDLIGDRGIGLMTGLFLVVCGNALPKELSPLSDDRCDPTRRQKLQRTAGWTLVIAGFATCAIWLFLPFEIAKYTGIAVTLGATGLIAARCLWASRAPTVI